MKYKALIGIEMHCEISKTNSKVFSNSVNGFNDCPNGNVRPLDMGFPGTMPVVNKEAVRKSIMMSLMLGCKVPEYLYFERKNYYYPDLPKGYQITQETKPAPIGSYGKLRYDCDGEFKEALINNIHLEEDTASMEHYDDFSTIDYNRSGVPLLELVTEPTFHNSKEVVAFLETVRSIYRYANISEADSKRGQIRCDVNVSIMDIDSEEIPDNYGTKVEIKGVNSFGACKSCIDYEIERQIKLKENNEYDQMTQHTRRWDEDSQTTIYMRDKVDAIDYKYFIDPNIPKIKLTSGFIANIRCRIPVLAHERKEIYINEYGLSYVDASTLVKEKNISDYYENTIKCGCDPKVASNWICSNILGYLNKELLSIDDIFVKPAMLKELIDMVNEGSISSKQGKEVLFKCLELNKEPKVVVEELGMKQIGSSDEILKIVSEVLDENEENILNYKNGRTNVVDYLVGQVMKKTKGQANPAITRSLMIEEIGKR